MLSVLIKLLEIKVTGAYLMLTKSFIDVAELEIRSAVFHPFILLFFPTYSNKQ